MITKIILVAILLCSMIIPVGGFLLSKRKAGGFKAALGCNVFFFFGTLLIADILMFQGDVQAAGEELLKDAAVDLLIGNNEKKNLPERRLRMRKAGDIWRLLCPQACLASGLE